MNIEEILGRYDRNQENILAILHEIQEHDPRRHVSAEAIRRVAAWLQIPLSSVYGVLRYYSMYSTTPRGRHLIRVCNSVVCRMQGSDLLMEKVREAVTEIESGGSENTMFSIETTECLGYCEGAPAMMADSDTVGPVDLAEVKDFLTKLSKR
jgi:NADH:ubiquinone oxidoreductase subunit E